MNLWDESSTLISQSTMQLISPPMLLMMGPSTLEEARSRKDQVEGHAPIAPGVWDWT